MRSTDKDSVVLDKHLNHSWSLSHLYVHTCTCLCACVTARMHARSLVHTGVLKISILQANMHFHHINSRWRVFTPSARVFSILLPQIRQLCWETLSWASEVEILFYSNQVKWSILRQSPFPPIPTTLVMKSICKIIFQWIGVCRSNCFVSIILAVAKGMLIAALTPASYKILGMLFIYFFELQLSHL